MKYDLLNGIETAFVTVEVRREMHPKELDVPCYVIEMWAAPPGEELAPKLLHVETPFSPFVFTITGFLFDALRDKNVQFEMKNETELEL